MINKQTIIPSLKQWLENPPDFYTVEAEFRKSGELKAAILKKKREIERVEETAIANIDKPRSAAAQQKKLAASGKLRDELTELEAQYAELEMLIKRLDYQKTMFNSASFVLRSTLDY